MPRYDPRRAALLALVVLATSAGCKKDGRDQHAAAESTLAERPAASRSLAAAARSAPPKSDPNSALVERGRYVVNAIADCRACHTKRNQTDFSLADGPEWAGGEVFDQSWKLPGVIITPNLTPDKETGLGNWTDAEILRALREGKNRAGEPLFPLMPSHFLRKMSDDDAKSVVAYLRSLPATKKPTDRTTKLAMPRAALPALPPLTEPVPPPKDDPVSRGEYFVTLGNCITCHSPTQGGGKPVPGKYLAGGVAFTTPFGNFVTPNITPDKTTGIGGWTDAELIALFRTGKRKNGTQLFVNFMPWWIYKNMTDDDLNAAIVYLRSLPPIKNRVADARNQYPLGG